MFQQIEDFLENLCPVNILRFNGESQTIAISNS